MRYSINRVCSLASILLLGMSLAACEPKSHHSGWDKEDAYWRGKYVFEPYYNNEFAYEIYRPAYLYGVQTYQVNHGRNFDSLNQKQLRDNWEKNHATESKLDWKEARSAVRSAYNHMEEEARKAKK